MSDNKRDITRIEDLGEYLHELGQDEEDQSSFEPPEEIPGALDFNLEDSTSSSEFVTEEENSFSSNNEFESDEPTFLNNESTDNTSETTNFVATDFPSEFESEETVEDTIDFSEAVGQEEEITKEVTEDKPEPIQQNYKAPENFEDLKKFAESSNFSGLGVEGNPSFSVLLRNIRFIEDVNDILTMMKELGVLSDSEEQVKQRLMRGHLLIPRISEYSAIFLAHKLRRFDIDIQVGLSDEIHPPKHQVTPEIGLTSKHSLYQNQNHSFHFDNIKIDIDQIIVASSPTLDGHQILKYIGVASEHKMLDGHIVEDESSEEIPRHYSELAQKLKAHALKANANAVIGLNYQLTPLPSDYLSGHKYRLSCTGNLVWVNKL